MVNALVLLAKHYVKVKDKIIYCQGPTSKSSMLHPSWAPLKKCHHDLVLVHLPSLFKTLRWREQKTTTSRQESKWLDSQNVCFCTWVCQTHLDTPCQGLRQSWSTTLPLQAAGSETNVNTVLGYRNMVNNFRPFQLQVLKPRSVSHHLQRQSWSTVCSETNQAMGRPITLEPWPNDPSYTIPRLTVERREKSNKKKYIERFLFGQTDR